MTDHVHDWAELANPIIYPGGRVATHTCRDCHKHKYAKDLV